MVFVTRLLNSRETEVATLATKDMHSAYMFRKGENSNSGLRCEDGDDGWTRWSFNWDTTQFKDDEYRISVRVVSAVGVVSDEIRRVVTVDNIDPMPDLLFVSKSISVKSSAFPCKSHT